MRIPSEILSNTLSESEKSSAAENTRFIPVESPENLRAALSNSQSPAHSQTEEQDSSRDHARNEERSTGRRNKPAQETAGHSLRSDERRKQDRRQAVHPVLLDTRTGHRRAGAGTYRGISIRA